VVLTALMLGAAMAGSATVAAQQPRLTSGSALAGFIRTAEPTTTADPTTTTTTEVAQTTTTEPPPPPPPPPPTTPPPPPTTTAPPAPPPTAAERVVDLVNRERRRAGCRALTIDQRIVAAAQAHSVDMATNRYFSHTSLDGRTFADRIREAGYPRPAAENIARGQRSADDVVRAWMNSSGHRANILNCGYTTIGVGLDTGGWYWTQDFGR